MAMESVEEETDAEKESEKTESNHSQETCTRTKKVSWHGLQKQQATGEGHCQVVKQPTNVLTNAGERTTMKRGVIAGLNKNPWHDPKSKRNMFGPATQLTNVGLQWTRMLKTA